MEALVIGALGVIIGAIGISKGETAGWWFLIAGLAIAVGLAQ
jgi:hypothetical protein